jgi:hypothetical protein
LVYIRKGRPQTLTEEHKQNIRKAMIGHRVSDETRKKMSIAQKGLHVGNKSASWKGGRNKQKSGYILICLPSNDPYIGMTHGIHNCVPEHRYIMAKHIGRCLKSWEIVHHINKIRDDNRIENLQLLDSREHSGFHQQWNLLQKEIKKIIKDLEMERDTCSSDKYGYIESDVYKKVVEKIKVLAD